MQNPARVFASTTLALLVLAVAFPTPDAAQQGGKPADSPSQSQDEFRRADPCGLVPDAPDTPQAQAEAEGIERHCGLGGSSGVAKGDFNNDGIADLAVGVPDELRTTVCCGTLQTGLIATDHPGSGAVNVIYGTSNGLTTTGNQTVDRGNLARADNLHYGQALAAGNFRGTTFSDLAVAVPGAKNSAGIRVGAIAVHFSTGISLPSSPSQVLLLDQFTSEDGLLEGSTMKMPNNPSMTWGDFNGDAVGDLAVEAQTCSSCTDPTSAVLVLYGSANTGFSTATNKFSVLTVNDGLSPNNFNPATGCIVSGVGQHICATSRGHVSLTAADLNNDSRSELLIGAPNCKQVDDSNRDLSGSGGFLGCVAIVPGRTGELDIFFGWDVLIPQFNGPEGRSGFGTAVAVGDFDADNVPDIAVGAPNTRSTPTNSGVVRVFPDVQLFGSQNEPGFTSQTLLLTQSATGLETAEAGDRFGATLAANKFNGDLAFDLAIGAPGENTATLTGAGQVHIIYGVSGTGLSTAASTGHPAAQNFLGGGLNGGAFGSTLSAWNFGKTAEADLAIGQPLANINLFGPTGRVTATLQGAGEVLVIYGSSANGLQNSGGAGAQRWSQFKGDSNCTVCTNDTAKSGNHFGAALY
jgi:hypothetical protein